MHQLQGVPGCPAPALKLIEGKTGDLSELIVQCACGAAPRAIQELAGHASISVTQRYMHLAPSALTEAIALLENRSALTTG